MRERKLIKQLAHSLHRREKAMKSEHKTFLNIYTQFYYMYTIAKYRISGGWNVKGNLYICDHISRRWLACGFPPDILLLKPSNKTRYVCFSCRRMSHDTFVFLAKYIILNTLPLSSSNFRIILNRQNCFNGNFLTGNCRTAKISTNDFS